MTTPPGPPPRIDFEAVATGDVHADCDLAELVCSHADIRDGDVVLITSKIVAKSEGRTRVMPRPAAVDDESRRVVARMGSSVIAETRHGLIMAAAGVDGSNTLPGTIVLLPLDPDESARRIRSGIRQRSSANVAVVVTDTAGRAWRVGQTDMAIGCAGLAPIVDLHGTRDMFGQELWVTAPAVADELAAAADLVKGKSTGRPIAIARGLADWVLSPDDDGPGAQGLVRDRDHDLFGLGAREAARAAALRDDSVALAHFPRLGALDPFDGLLDSWARDLPGAESRQVTVELAQAACLVAPGEPVWQMRVRVLEAADPATAVSAGRLIERAHTLAAAARLTAHPVESSSRDCPLGSGLPVDRLSLGGARADTSTDGGPTGDWIDLFAGCWHARID